MVCPLLVASLLGGCSGTTGPTAVAQKYISDWSTRDYSAMRALVSHAPADFVSLNRQVAADFDLERATYRLGAITTHGSDTTAPVTEDLTIVPFGALELHSTLSFTDTGAGWRVEWSPRSILPQLSPGDSVVTTVSWPTRAQVLGENGVPLTTDQQMVSVGIEGSRVNNQAALTSALEQAGATAPEISAALQIATAHPQWFVPVISISQASYEQLKPVIYPVPGTVFQDFSTPAAVTPGLTAHVVGSVGAITAEELSALGAPYQANDTVGQSGIEQAYERQLAGKPGGSIDIVDSSQNHVATVATFASHPGSPVETTIDPTVQQAAESALAGVTQPAALVAIQASTGDVLASVSLPSSTGFDNALNGSFPPGSTFKVITSADLIEHGLTPASPATCPATITVGGETFHNFEGETAASLSLEQAFAESCNAAFIGLSSSLPDASFPQTASQFGIGAPFQMGLSAFAGKVPAPSSDAERAATAIGQAGVLVSPLDMAMVAAAADSGILHLPRLVAGSPDDTSTAAPIDQTVVADLKAMMAAVVDSPTGTAAGAGLPAGTYGKTGTAEFGSANPPQTHAWFIGYRGDLAFAVLVVGGGIGGAVAAPIAAKFLDAAGSS